MDIAIKTEILIRLGLMEGEIVVIEELLNPYVSNFVKNNLNPHAICRYSIKS